LRTQVSEIRLALSDVMKTLNVAIEDEKEVQGEGGAPLKPKTPGSRPSVSFDHGDNSLPEQKKPAEPPKKKTFLGRASLAVDESLDPVAWSRKGHNTIMYGGKHATLANKVLMFLETNDPPTLYFCNRGHFDKIPENRMMLHELSDIYVGKQHPLFEKDDAVNAVYEKSMTLVGRNLVWNIEVDLKDDIKLWLNALQIACANIGKVMQAELVSEDVERKGGLRFSMIKQLKSVTNSAGVRLTNDDIVELMSLGTDVVVFSKAPDSSAVTSRRLILFLQNNALFWSGSNRREMFSDQSISFADVSEILTGKSSAVLKHLVASDANPRACLTFKARGLEFNFEFDGETTLLAWLTGIKYLIRKLGKAIMLDPSTAETADKRFTVAFESERGAVPTGLSALEALHKGAKGTLYEWLENEEANGEIVLHNSVAPVTLFYDDRALYFYAGEARVKDPEQRMLIKDMTDVFLGKRSEEFLKGVGTKAEATACLTLRGKVIDLNIEFDHADTRQMVLNALKFLASNAGRDVVLEKKSNKPVPQDEGRSRSATTGGAMGRQASMSPGALARSNTGLGSAVGSQAPLARANTGLGSPPAMIRGLTHIPAPSPPGQDINKMDVMVSLIETTGPSKQLREKEGGGTVAPAGGGGGGKPAPLVRQYSERTMGSLEILKLMKNGRRFTRYEEVEGMMKRTEIMMWYEADADGKSSGTFCWAKEGELGFNAGDKKARPSHSFIHLAAFTDIYVGKQSPTLSDELLSAVDPANCMTLASPSQALELSTSEDGLVSKWLSGIQFIVANTGKPVILNTSNDSPLTRVGSLSVAEPYSGGRVSSASSPPGHAALGGEASGPPGQRAPAGGADTISMNEDLSAIPIGIADRAEAVRVVVEGRLFNMFEDGVRKRVMLFYSNHQVASGGFFWCDPAQAKDVNRKVAQRSIPLSSIIRMVLGKTTEGFRHPSAERAPPSMCFSLVSKSGEFDFEATSTDIVQTFMNGLKHLAKAGGRRAKEVVKGGVHRLAVRDRRIKKSADKQSMALTIKSLTTGRNFTIYEEDSKGNISQKDVFVYFRPEPINTPGTLFWVESGFGEHGGRASLPLRQLKAIYVGKQTKTLQASELMRLPPDRCFTIVGKRGALNILGQSKEQVTHWLVGLQQCLSSGGKSEPAAFGGAAASATLNALPAERRANELAQVTMGQASESDQLLSVSSNAHVQMMVQGSIMTGYSDLKLGRKNVFVFLNPLSGDCGAIYWCEPGEKIEWPSCRIGIDELVEIYVNDGVANPVNRNDPRLSFTLISRDNMIVLEPTSAEYRASWLSGIHILLKQLHRDFEVAAAGSVPAVSPAAGPQTGSRYSLVELEGGQDQRRGSIVALSSSDSTGVLTEGRSFTRYFETGPNRYGKEEVFVFYEQAADPPLGTLYWCPEGKRERAKERSVPVAQIEEIFLAKQTKALLSSAAADAVPGRCFSLLTAAGVLDLEAGTLELMGSFLLGVNTLLTSGGRQKIVSMDGVSQPDFDLKQHMKNNVNMDSAPLHRYSVAGSNGVPRKEKHGDSDASLITDPQEAVFALEKGKLYSAFDESSERNVVLIWLDRSVGRFGTLYWGQPGAGKVRNPNTCVNLANLTDMYLGKSIPALRSGAAATVPDLRCIALLAADITLCLAGDRENDVKVLLLGINQVLSSGGRRVVEEREDTPIGEVPSPDARVVNTSILMTPYDGPRRFAACGVEDNVGDGKLPMKTADDNLAALEKGFLMNRYNEKDLTVKKMLIFYKQGSLYWCAADQKQEYESFEMQSVTDLFVGKFSKCFGLTFAKGAVFENCCTIISKTTSLDLEAVQGQDVALFLRGLHCALLQDGCKVVMTNTLPVLARIDNVIRPGPRGYSVSISANRPKRTPHEGTWVAIIGLGPVGQMFASAFAGMAAEKDGLVTKLMLWDPIDSVSSNWGSKFNKADNPSIVVSYNLETLADADMIFVNLPVVNSFAETMAKLQPSLLPNTMLVDCSCVDSSVLQFVASNLAMSGTGTMDVAVMGRGLEGYKSAPTSALIGGSNKDYWLLMPLVSAVADKAVYTGVLGSAHSTKAVTVNLEAAQAVLLAESLALLQKSGVSAKSALNAINCTGAKSYLSERILPVAMDTGMYEAGPSYASIRKEVSAANNLAQRLMPNNVLVGRASAHIQQNASDRANYSELIKQIERANSVTF
jgi:3-hydroxyisobutyrate dehydrogenase-like beta-hydroxyacid dehydrogenase